MRNDMTFIFSKLITAISDLSVLPPGGKLDCTSLPHMHFRLGICVQRMPHPPGRMSSINCIHLKFSKIRVIKIYKLIRKALRRLQIRTLI